MGRRSRSASIRLKTTSRPTQYWPPSTERMHRSNNSVADSFSTTPRAPSWMAWATSAFSIAAASTTVRVLDTGPISRRASSPVWRGMFRSSRSKSGLSRRTPLTASIPSPASPMTRRSGSTSSSFRRPWRRIGWSSASRRRTVSGLLSINFLVAVSLLRKSDLKARAVTRNGFDRQLTSDGPYALFEHQRAAGRLELSLGETPGKLKASTVILDHQLPQAALSREADQHAARVAMLADVHQRLLQDARQLVHQVSRQSDLPDVGDEPGANTGVAAKLVNNQGQAIRELPAVQLERFHALDQVAHVQYLLPQATVDAPESIGHAGGVARSLTVGCGDFHFNADEGLDDPVVEFARDPGPLHRHGAGTQAAQTVDAVNRRRQPLGQIMKQTHL